MTNEIQPWITASLIDRFPDPQDLKRVVKERIEEAYAAAVAERGEVRQAEDTYQVQRRLQATYEQLDAYKRGFGDAGKVIRKMQEEQLLDAVGEQDGIPLSGLTIPTADGDIRVTPEFKRDNIIDPEQVRSVIAAQAARNVNALIVAEHGDPEAHIGGMDETELAAVIDEAFGALIGCGKFEPQVTRVKATAAEFARAGDDKMAAALAEAIKVKQTYQDRVKVDRKAPK